MDLQVMRVVFVVVKSEEREKMNAKNNAFCTSWPQIVINLNKYEIKIFTCNTFNDE